MVHIIGQREPNWVVKGGANLAKPRHTITSCGTYIKTKEACPNHLIVDGNCINTESKRKLG